MPSDNGRELKRFPSTRRAVPWGRQSRGAAAPGGADPALRWQEQLTGPQVAALARSEPGDEPGGPVRCARNTRGSRNVPSPGGPVRCVQNTQLSEPRRRQRLCRLCRGVERSTCIITRWVHFWLINACTSLSPAATLGELLPVHPPLWESHALLLKTTTTLVFVLCSSLQLALAKRKSWKFSQAVAPCCVLESANFGISDPEASLWNSSIAVAWKIPLCEIPD